MNTRRVLLLVFLLCLITALPAAAQSSPLVALMNSSGQLIVSSADGSYRWIVTNPGQTLAGDFAWASKGNQVLFAVGTTLNSGSVAQQSVQQIGQVAGNLISLSPDGKFVFYQGSNGAYAIQALKGGATTKGALSNDVGAPNNGVWSSAESYVAYWDYNGNSNLGVTNAANGQSVTIDSNSSAPVLPLVWQGGDLIYRDSDGYIRTANFACLDSGCNNTGELDVRTLVSGDASIALDGRSLYFRSGSNISVVDLHCVDGGTCQSSAVVIAQNAAPQTAINVAKGTLIYTAYSANPADPHDREVNTLDLSCVSNPSSCAPQTVLTQAAAGAVSSDGHYAVVDSGSGLQILDLSSGATTYLADEGADLNSAVWQS